MPNHVINKLYVTVADENEPLPDLANRYAMQVVGEYVANNDPGFDDGNRLFDFNKIVPQPPEVLESLANNEGAFPLWYSWRVSRMGWGTKWNAYDVIDADTHFAFNTAWSTPDPVIQALSQQFPTYTFYVEYADEDIGGDNHGTYTYINGELVGETEEDRMFALAIWKREDYTDEDDEEEDTDEDDAE